LPAGTVHDTVALPLPRTAATSVGARGTVAGITAFEEADSTESPAALVATTLNVYEFPFVRPVTSHGEEAHDCVAPKVFTV